MPHPSQVSTDLSALLCIIQVLSLGVDVLVCDIDTVWLQV
jgi:hypothetical protein